MQLRSNANDAHFSSQARAGTKASMLQVTQKERNSAKQLAYGLLYGMGSAALASRLNISVPEAAQKSKNFKASLPGLFGWREAAITACK